MEKQQKFWKAYLMWENDFCKFVQEDVLLQKNILENNTNNNLYVNNGDNYFLPKNAAAENIDHHQSFASGKHDGC